MVDMSEEVKDQQFVEYIVKAIVDHPEDVSAERTVDEMGTLISLHVNAEDMGTIIGKEGRTAKALRTLLRVYGAKNNARVNLKIIEPDGGQATYERMEETVTPHSYDSSTDTDLADALSDIPQDELA